MTADRVEDLGEDVGDEGAKARRGRSERSVRGGWTLRRRLAAWVALLPVPCVALAASAAWAPETTFTVSMLCLVASILCGIAAYRHVLGMVVEPLEILHRAAERLRAGDLDHRIDSARKDEVGDVADALDAVVAELQASADQLIHRGLHDPLTGLANRVLLHDRLDHAIAQANRHGEAVAVLLIDLDDFKTVNESLGHTIGDRLLIAAAARISACLRVGDTAARLGGDEFAILVQIGDADTARDIADRVNNALLVPFPVGGSNAHINASIGIALSSPMGDNVAEVLLRNAELAMYAAKRRGGGRHELFESPMYVAAVERLTLEDELRQALDGDELVVHYQPTIDLRTGEVEGYEALVRWMHPTRGLLSPADFLPLAEATGLITAIGWRVLDAACRQLAEWQHVSGRPLEVHVNLSASQLLDPDLIGHVTGAIERSGIEPATLTLEITETVMMNDGDLAHDLLSALRARGVCIAIDDFGTGYSSLRYLQHFPIDVLKVDKSFVDGIEGNGPTAMVEAIVSLAHRLNLRTVAEGIERQDQVGPLCDLGCTVGQGFLFARPADPATISESLTAGRRPVELR